MEVICVVACHDSVQSFAGLIKICVGRSYFILSPVRFLTSAMLFTSVWFTLDAHITYIMIYFSLCFFFLSLSFSFHSFHGILPPFNYTISMLILRLYTLAVSLSVLVQDCVLENLTLSIRNFFICSLKQFRAIQFVTYGYIQVDISAYHLFYLFLLFFVLSTCHQFALPIFLAPVLFP
jgi:hypothetical protein